MQYSPSASPIPPVRSPSRARRLLVLLIRRTATHPGKLRLIIYFLFVISYLKNQKHVKYILTACAYPSVITVGEVQRVVAVPVVQEAFYQLQLPVFSYKKHKLS